MMSTKGKPWSARRIAAEEERQERKIAELIDREEERQAVEWPREIKPKQERDRDEFDPWNGRNVDR